MKSKALFILFGTLVILGMGATIYFGLSPKPIPKIKFSSFEGPSKFSQAIELRLHEEIKNASVLVFGFQPERIHQLEIIREFLRIHREPEMAYDVLVAEEGLGELGAGFESFEKIDMKGKVADLALGIKNARAAGKRVLLVMPSSYSTQMLKDNVTDQLKAKFQIALTSFSIVELLRHRELEKSVSIPCFVSDTGTDLTGTGPLGCAILQQSRATYRKKSEVGKLTGMLDQRGSTDYLIFYE